MSFVRRNASELLKKFEILCFSKNCKFNVKLNQLEENKELQIDKNGYEMFDVHTSNCLGSGSLDNTDGDGLPHVPDGEPTKRREV